MTHQDTIKMLEQEWRDRLEEAVKQEREACALVCANLMIHWDENTPNRFVIADKNDGMRQCAAAIRARGQQ